MGSNPAAPTIIWPWAALFGLLAALFAPPVLGDPDTLWHLAAGDWILRHRAVPSVDPFSWTFGGADWHAHEWLAELLMQLAFRAGSWSGLLVLFGLAAGLTLGLLAHHLGRWLAPVPTVAVSALAAACIGPSLLARPHLLALPLLELWTAWLLIGRERGRPPLRLLLLMPVWANLHGSFVLGLLLLAAFALEQAIRRGRSAWPWCTLLLAAAAAACLQPWGWRGLLFPVQLLSLRQLGAIREWQPTDFATMPPIELALLAVLFICLTRGVRVSVLRALILLAVLHLALSHSRHQMVAGIVGALMLAAPLGRVLRAPRPMAARPILLRAAAGAAVVAVLLRLALPASPPAAASAALVHLPEPLRARHVLNEYGLGGALIFAGIRPYVDGRADLYGDAFLQRYAAIVRPDRALLAQELREREIAWTIFPAGSPVLAAMDDLGWTRLHADEQAVIHVAP